MNFDAVSDKNFHELEKLTKELLEVLRRANLLDHPLTEMLHRLEAQAENARPVHPDAVNPEFQA